MKELTDERIEKIVDMAFRFLRENLMIEPSFRRILRKSAAWKKSHSRLSEKNQKNKLESEVLYALDLDYDEGDDEELENEVDAMLDLLTRHPTFLKDIGS